MKKPPESWKQPPEAAFSWRESRLGELYYKTMRNGLLPGLRRTGLTPNQMTVLGSAVAALVPLGFFLHPLAGFLLLCASGIADSLDGMIARDSKMSSSFGAFLDSSLDRLSDFFYLTGFWILFWPRGYFLAATLLFFTALLLTSMISYVKARAEALGAGCPVGIMERAARVVYLLIWALLTCLLPGHAGVVLWCGLGIYCGLTLTTVLQRIYYVRRQMTATRPPAP